MARSHVSGVGPRRAGSVSRRTRPAARRAILVVSALLTLIYAGLAQAATVTISPADNPPENSVLGAAIFDVTLTGADGLSTYTVDFSTAQATALDGPDYTGVSGPCAGGPDCRLTFMSDTTQLIQIPVVDDALDEDAETFQVVLSNAQSTGDPLTILSDTGIATIADDDATPTVSINDPASVTEGATITFTATLSAASGRDVSVSFATADASAVAGLGNDYTSSAGTLTFTVPPASNEGPTSQTFTVTTLDDTRDENTETFTASLSSPLNVTLLDATGTGTIGDNDPPPTIAIGNATVTEGNAGTTNATFTVTPIAVSGLPITGTVTVAGPTANAADFGTLPTTFTIPAGSSSGSIVVPISGDGTFEATETYTVSLSAVTNITVSGSDLTGAGTINNDDAAPTIVIDDVALAEGSVGTTSAVFTVTPSAVSGLPIIGTVTVAGPTANAADFGTLPTTFTIPAGSSSGSIVVPINADTTFEADESYSVALSGVTDITVTGSDLSGAGTINNDDAAPTITISNVSVAEGNAGTTSAVFTVTPSAVSGLPIAGTVTVTNGTTDAADFDPGIPTTFTIPAGAASDTVTVPISADTTFEANETYTVTLSAVTNITVSGSDLAGTGTINNDDPAPTITIDDVTVTEGNAGVTNATFTVGSSAVSGLPIAGTVTVTNGTTSAADFGPGVPTSFSIPAGGTSTGVTIPIAGDTTDETNETYTVTLGSVTGITPAGSDLAGAGVITDDDTTLTLSKVSPADPIAEGSSIGGSTTITYRVTATNPPPAPVPVDWTVTPVTTDAADFSSPLTGTVSVGATGSADFIVNVAHDRVDEPTNETFTVAIANTGGPGTVNVPASPLTTTIVDDDTTLTLSGPPTITEGNPADPATIVTYTLTATNPSASALAVNWVASTIGGSGQVSTADFSGPVSGTVNLAANQASGTFSVQVARDTLDEFDEPFTVTATNASAPAAGTVTISASPFTTTIADDDAVTTTFAINSVTVAEGAGTATFTVTMTGATGRNVTVTAGAASGTDLPATGALGGPAGAPIAWDFVLPTTQILAINVPAGQNTIANGTTASFTVPIIDDPYDEPATEQFNVALTAPDGGTVPAPPTPPRGSITDNDNPPVATIVPRTGAEAIQEGINDGAVPVTIQLSQPSGQPGNVRFLLSTRLNTAVPAEQRAGVGTDYLAPLPLPPDPLEPIIQGNVTFPGGSVAGNTNAGAATTLLEGGLTIRADALDEYDESLLMDLARTNDTQLNNWATVGGVGAGTGVRADILDDPQDLPPVVAIPAPSAWLAGPIIEGDPPTANHTVNVPVRLGAPSGKITQVTVNQDTTVIFPNPHATLGTDFAAAFPTVVQFAPGETEKLIPVQIIHDTVKEIPNAENVWMRLTAPGNLVLGPGDPDPLLDGSLGRITILDDDSPPTPPVAAPDSLTVPRNVAGTVLVLANDSDVNPTDLLRVTATSTPAHGTVMCQPTGECQYTPSPDYAGPDSFTYTVWDGTVDPATQERRQSVGTVTVTVTPTNRAPSAGPDVATTTQPNPVTIPVLANDSDPDGNAVSIIGNTTPANGTASCSTQAGCVYTPVTTFAGTDSFQYTISDGASIATGTVTVTVTPAAKRALQLTLTTPTKRTAAGKPVTYTLKVTSPNPVPVKLGNVSVCLPKGFKYTRGSTSGMTRKDPVQSGCGAGRKKLVWAGAFVLAPGGSAKVVFKAGAGGVGVSTASAAGKAAAGYVVAAPKKLPAVTVIAAKK